MLHLKMNTSKMAKSMILMYENQNDYFPHWVLITDKASTFIMVILESNTTVESKSSTC